MHYIAGDAFLKRKLLSGFLFARPLPASDRQKDDKRCGSFRPKEPHLSVSRGQGEGHPLAGLRGGSSHRGAGWKAML